jgi:toxin ParE1/3/4|tara:strand:- start:186 stop:488 length:303 start_codon:yes stop_codon:yes gene_type:complete
METELSLTISTTAASDLEKIYDYTLEQWSYNQAEKYQDVLFDTMNLLCNRPEIGKTYESSSRSFRVFLVGKHIMFYLIQDHELLVVRILHVSILKEHWIA